MGTSSEQQLAASKRPRGRVIGLAIATFVAFCFGLIFLSPTYQECTTRQDEAANGNNPEERTTAIGAGFIKFVEWGDCVVSGIEANDKFVVAVSTLFIAIFTLTLWWSTKRLGDFAKRQADDTKESLRIANNAVQAALITAGANGVMANAPERSLENEREALRIAAEVAAATKLTADATKLQAETARESIKPRVHAQPWPHTARIESGNFRFQLELHCYGNSTATVTGLCVQHSHEPPRGERAAYTIDPVPVNIGLAPGNRWWYPEIQTEFLSTPINQPFIFGYVGFEDQFGGNIRAATRPS